MSYSVDLWNSFDKIGNLLLTNLKGAKNLIDIFNNLYTSIQTFSDNIKSLYHNYDYDISSHKSLDEAILYFKEDFLNINNYLIDFTIGIKNEIIKPLGNMQSILLSKYLSYKDGLNQLEEDYKESVKELENNKSVFYKSVKDVEDYKINYEFKKQNFRGLSPEYKKEEEEKILELLKIAKEEQKNYILNINRINKIQNYYIEKKKYYLNSVQYMEEKLGECVKDSLRKFILYLMAFIRNLQYDSENTSKKYDEIDINKDIKNFISQNSTNDIIPFKYEFIPYSSNIGKRYKNVSNNIIKEIRNFISTIFNNDIELQNYASLSNNKKTMDIQEMAEFIFRINNNKYADKELYYKEKVNYILLDRRTRKSLLQEINKIRIKGSYFINDFNFNNIGNTLKSCINIIVNESKKLSENENDEDYLDYESMNLIFIIATNLYKMNEYGNKPRLFLQESLVNTPIFANFDFWKKIIRYFIINEMHTQKKYDMYETNVIKEEKRQKLIKNQINSFKYHMIAFEVKDKLINDIIYFFQNYYGLDKKMIEPLLINNEKNKVKECDNYDDNNCFQLDGDGEKDGDNNFVINIPNISFNHQSSIHSLNNNNE
jgi:hypothetical protein